MVDQVEAALATSDERPTSGRSGARARVGHNVDDVMACVIVAADLCADQPAEPPLARINWERLGERMQNLERWIGSAEAELLC
ncbi:hypothetical protein ACQ5SK_23380 [Bradyrhizobium japonicum]